MFRRLRDTIIIDLIAVQAWHVGVLILRGVAAYRSRPAAGKPLTLPDL